MLSLEPIPVEGAARVYTQGALITRTTLSIVDLGPPSLPKAEAKKSENIVATPESRTREDEDPTSCHGTAEINRSQLSITRTFTGGLVRSKSVSVPEGSSLIDSQPKMPVNLRTAGTAQGETDDAGGCGSCRLSYRLVPATTAEDYLLS
jgi:hypothetical protein